MSLASEAPEPRAERKVVTVVFCDLVGLTARAEQLDPEDVQAVLGPYQAQLGAPVAHEDDAERAMRAASFRDAAITVLDGDFARVDEIHVEVGLKPVEGLLAKLA